VCDIVCANCWGVLTDCNVGVCRWIGLGCPIGSKSRVSGVCVESHISTPLAAVREGSSEGSSSASSSGCLSIQVSPPLLSAVTPIVWHMHMCITVGCLCVYIRSSYVQHLCVYIESSHVQHLCVYIESSHVQHTATT